jgi:hypothetical protein
MADADAIERRLSAVERAISGDDGPADLRTPGEQDQRVADVEGRLTDLEETVTDVEAAIQALRGYVGNVRSVNRDVEQRAEAALAAVDRLEARIDGDVAENGSAGAGRRSVRSASVDRETGDQEVPGVTARDDGEESHPDADDLTTGPEMSVRDESGRRGTTSESVAHHGTPPDRTDPGDEHRPQSDDGGVFARVRDAL